MRFTRQRIFGADLWRFNDSLDSINKSKRRYPTWNAIRAYWAPILSRTPWNKFSSIDHCLSGEYCFACGGIWLPRGTERAHIVARVYGGRDELWNFHLLCPICHDESGLLKGGLRYWRWLKSQTYERAVWTGASFIIGRLYGPMYRGSISFDLAEQLARIHAARVSVSQNRDALMRLLPMSTEAEIMAATKRPAT
jgi:hypothetical protein